MEAAGLALGIFGAVGVLGQLLDGCLKGYKIFTTASNLGRDSETLTVKIRIEEMRLTVWGKEWGLAEGQFENNLTAGTADDTLRGLAELILTQLYQTIMDLNKLQNRYGFREEAPGSVDKEAYKKTAADPAKFIASKSGGNFRLRARWVIGDKEKCETFLEDLRYYNDRLERLFPPRRVDTLQRAWKNELLQRAERDLNKLDLLEAASKPLYPGLSTFAELKQLQINLDAKEPSRKILSTSELKIPRSRLVEQPNGPADPMRKRAIYQKPTDVPIGGIFSEDVQVIVEWTLFESTLGIEERCHIYQKIDNLARMLHSSSNRHPDLHTLDCLGYVEDAEKSRYGMLYISPPTADLSLGMQSLATLIANAPAPDLDVRFKLAHTIAVALWSCHSLDWLHKTLCPHNILFFNERKPAAGVELAIDKPYLAGFDSSRPDHLEEMSVASKNLVGEELYRHPASLGPHRKKYRKAFDVYSLGLLLLEIGLWKGLDVLQKAKYAKYTPSTLREKIIQALVPALGSKTGGIYKRLVQQCLTYESPELAVPAPVGTGSGTVLSPHQMMESIVQTLEGLHV